MKINYPEPYGRDLILRFEAVYELQSAVNYEEETSYLALRQIYLEAGLSVEDAQKSAAADLEDFFDCLTPCAA